MPSKSNTLEEELRQKRAKQAALEAALRESKALDAKIISEREDRDTLLPPFEEIDEQKKQHQFDEKASRHEVENLRRTLRHNAFLNLLLLIAVIAVLWWAYQTLLTLQTAR